MRLRGSASWSAVALVAALSHVSLVGCGGEPRVVRVYDGRVVEGRYVSPDGYAAYLRAVLSEESGDLKGAASQLEMAVAEDDEDPEVWSRMGEVRCKLDPRSGRADEAFARALRADPAYAGALAAKSRCAALRGRTEEAAELAGRAAAADPGNVALEALVVRTDARRPTPPMRERAIALTLAHREHAAAWDALVAWSRARRDPELYARGLEGLLRSAPARSPEVERGARELSGEGQLALARKVAAVIADAPADLLVRGPRDPVVARLAIDEALARGDAESARRRATRGHVELAEVAARALLLEERSVAVAVAEAVLTADPRSSGARMVLAAVDASHARAYERPAPGDGESPPELCALVFADRLDVAVGSEAARAWLERVSVRPPTAHDPVATALTVELAARGALGVERLVPEARIELAARRREIPPELDAGADIDERHALLRLALVEPSGAHARSLAARLSAALERDPLVAFAVARVALSSEQLGGSMLERLRAAFARAPSNALLLSLAVEVAKKQGRPEDAAPAKARLMAVARTPAERALASE